MEPRQVTPVIVTFLAALAFLYPMTTATRAPSKNAAPPTDLSRSSPESAEDDSAKNSFPTAKDLVSEFLFRGGVDQAASSGGQTKPGYTIDLLIATVPDPVSSRLPHFFDSFVESLESAAEASGYTLDRFALPWLEKGNSAGDYVPSWRHTLYETVPGLILYRDPQHQKLLLVFLVGETPTTGIHKRAMFSALEQMAQFYSWDPKHEERPQSFPWTTDSG